jgi:hypothetical protein
MKVYLVYGTYQRADKSGYVYQVERIFETREGANMFRQAILDDKVPLTNGVGDVFIQDMELYK